MEFSKAKSSPWLINFPSKLTGVSCHYWVKSLRVSCVRTSQCLDRRSDVLIHLLLPSPVVWGRWTVQTPSPTWAPSGPNYTGWLNTPCCWRASGKGVQTLRRKSWSTPSRKRWKSQSVSPWDEWPRAPVSALIKELGDRLAPGNHLGFHPRR